MISSIVTIVTVLAIVSYNTASANPPLINITSSNSNFESDYHRFSVFGQPTITDNEDIVFSASLTNDSSSYRIFKSTKGVISSIVASGDPTPVGGVFSVVGSPSANSDKVIFHGIIKKGSSNQGIFQKSNGKISKIVLEGDAAPDGGVFAEFSSSPRSVNKKGDIVFYSFVQKSLVEKGELEFFGKNGIFKFSNDQISKIALVGDPAPNGGNFNIIRYGVQPINDKGDIVFTSTVIDGSSFQGIFKSSGGKISSVISSGEKNDKGITFSQFGPPSINNKGDVVFFGGNTNIPSSKGIYKISEGKVSKMLSVGDVSPLGGTFHNMDAILIDDNGNISFLGFIKDGKTNYGVFRISGNKISNVSNGDISPTGETFKSVFMPIMNNNGNVVFSALLNSKTPTQGIFLMNLAKPYTLLGGK